MSPLDTYLLSKEAGWKDRFAQNVGDGVVQTAVGLAMVGAVPAVKGIYNAISRKKHFSDMMHQNSDLDEIRRDNPRQFNHHYSSLRNMNPTFASDPIVAGSYMRQMGMSPGTAGSVVVESLRSLPSSQNTMEIGFKDMGVTSKLKQQF